MQKANTNLGFLCYLFIYFFQFSVLQFVTVAEHFLVLNPFIKLYKEP